MKKKHNISDKYNKLSGKELNVFEDELLENYLDNKLSQDVNKWFENILIDKYIENEWDKKQTLQIEKLFGKDHNLKTKYQSWIKASDILQRQTETAKIKKLITEQLKEDSILKETTGKIIKLNKRNHQYILLAASFIILFGIGITIWLNFRPYSPNKLYAMYYEPYKLDFEITRDSLPANEFIVKAQKAFLNGETENTIKYIEQAITENPENRQLYLNLGSIYMVTAQFEKAITIYEKLPSDAGYYYETARWYLGLCYVKIENQEKAIEVFTQLKTEGKYYTEKTTDILNRIN